MGDGILSDVDSVLPASCVSKTNWGQSMTSSDSDLAVFVALALSGSSVGGRLVRTSGAKPGKERGVLLGTGASVKGNPSRACEPFGLLKKRPLGTAGPRRKESVCSLGVVSSNARDAGFNSFNFLSSLSDLSHFQSFFYFLYLLLIIL